jgi:hypothetical protein
MKAKDTTKTKGLQKVTNLITKEVIDKVVESKDLIKLRAIAEELLVKYNANLNHSKNFNLDSEIRTDAAMKFEDASELLLHSVSNVNDETFIRFEEKIRRITYDTNRTTIMLSIKESIIKYNKIPTQTEIAQLTGLSRTTVIKHLNEITTEQEYKEIKQSTAVMLPIIMAKLYKLCLEGNVRALKIFLDFHKQSEATMYIKNQQNNLQINKLGKDLADESYL